MAETVPIITQADAMTVACPVCRAEPGEPCLFSEPGPDAVHIARYRAKGSAKRMTKRQLADEAFLRNEQMRTDDPPTAPAVEYPALDGVPANCPECRLRWNEVLGLNPLLMEEGAFLAKAQCAGCGNIFLIPVEGRARIVAARAIDRERIAARAAEKKPKRRPPRERGAG